jgi:Zn-dependent oligopeptidase
MICFIIDASELIRNVHPDPNWRSAAQQSYSMLGNLINQLNTHTGLYNALDASIQQSARANHTGISEETLAVARLFHSDFVKSGARLGQSKRSDLVRINDRINTLGHEFMTLSSYRRGEYPDNSILKLEEMLQERFKLAKLLGYPSYAHLFLADKMAKTPGIFISAH